MNHQEEEGIVDGDRKRKLDDDGGCWGRDAEAQGVEVFN